MNIKRNLKICKKCNMFSIKKCYLKCENDIFGSHEAEFVMTDLSEKCSMQLEQNLIKDESEYFEIDLKELGEENEKN